MMPSTTTTTTTNSQDTGGMQIQTPEHFICSISGEIFKDPVIASDGQTYERASIEKWIAQNGHSVTSPLTGATLSNHTLTPNHMVKSMISSWQQKNKNGIDFDKALKTIGGELLTAETTDDVVETISKIVKLVQSSPKVLVTAEKINKWKKMIQISSLLTTEVVSSFSVLESEILMFLNKKTDELKKFNAIKDCQLIIMKAKEENNIKLRNKYIESEKAYNEAQTNFKNVKKSLLINTQQIEILKKMNENIELKIKNVKDIGNSSSMTGRKRKTVDETSNGSSSSSSSSTFSPSRKKRRKQKTDNNNNASIDLSIGARELMMNGFNHLIVHAGYGSIFFIPLKYQTMIEISAYGGFDLAIGICHICGFGNFIKDAEKGFAIITKYYENNKNDNLSQNILGFLHYCNKIGPLKGFAWKDNDKKLFEFFSKSAEQGDAYGQYRLGVCYNDGSGVEEDNEKAFDLFMKSAKQGLAAGQYRVGRAYLYGFGVTRDFEQAVQWLAKSGEQGYVRSQNMLGIEFETTYDKKDYTKAYEWYKKASEVGYANSSKNIGDLYDKGDTDFPKDEEKALEWYKLAIEQNSNLLNNIGDHYLFRLKYKLAFEFYTKSTQQNKDAESMADIARMYRMGQYVERDYKKAEEWYQKAADHCKDCGQYDYELAKLYHEGNVFPQNYSKAFENYMKAIEKTNEEDSESLNYAQMSQKQLGIMYKNGEGVRKSYKKALAYFTKAVEHEEDGDTEGKCQGEAQYLLGNMYHHGYGVKKDLKKAKEWYEKAAKDTYEDGEEGREANAEAIEMLQRNEFNMQ